MRSCTNIKWLYQNIQPSRGSNSIFTSLIYWNYFTSNSASLKGGIVKGSVRIRRSLFSATPCLSPSVLTHPLLFLHPRKEIIGKAARQEGFKEVANAGGLNRLTLIHDSDHAVILQAQTHRHATKTPFIAVWKAKLHFISAKIYFLTLNKKMQSHVSAWCLNLCFIFLKRQKL